VVSDLRFTLARPRIHGVKFELYEGASRTHFTSKVAATRERDLPEAFSPTILKGAVPREKDDDNDGARTWGKSGRKEAKGVERDGQSGLSRVGKRPKVLHVRLAAV